MIEKAMMLSRRLSSLHLFLLALFAAAAIFGSVLAQAQAPAPGAAPAPPPRPDIEQMRQVLSQIEAQLQRETVADSELEQQRTRLGPIIDGVEAIIARETPRLDEVNARLEKIGPAPKEGEPRESAEVSRNRAEQQALKKEIDDSIRVARLVQVRAEQALTAISDYRRRLFARELLARSESILNPVLWWDALSAMPAAAADFAALTSFRIRQTWMSLEPTRLWLALLMAAIAIAAYWPTRKLLFARFDPYRHTEEGAPSRGARAGAALKAIVLRVGLVLTTVTILAISLRMLGFGADRLAEFMRMLLFSLPILAGLRATLTTIIQPNRPAWRVARIEQATASQLHPALWSVVMVVFAGKIIEAAGQSISAALPVTIASRGLAALVAALILLRALRNIDAIEDAKEQALDEFGPAVAASAGDTYAVLLKIFGWFTGLSVIAALVLGYISFGAFLMDQVVWLLGLGGLLALLIAAVDEFVLRGTRPESGLARRIRASTGVSPQSIQQIGILSSGLLRMFAYAAGLLMALAPFGVHSGDLLGSLRTALFGFTVGGVTISLWNIFIAIVAFLALFAVFRAIQRWFEQTYLPSTSLDAGLQNSIATVIGYIGFILATLLGLSYLGLSLDKIAIVAGALSVGIGFGLQSIVNNFVSGLILLWERPIKVGDLIVVANETGRVRRINVRSTEIETADRTSLIVPNAEFISGRVKNMMHANRIARVVIPISVAPSADPETIRRTLLACANAHPEVMSSPESQVVFLAVSQTSLDFELRCFTDIDSQLPVRSDLMFEVHKRLTALGAFSPPPKPAASVDDIRELLDRDE